MSDTPPEPQLFTLGSLLEEWEAEATAAHEAYTTKQPRGPITGHEKLDEALGGALQVGVHVIHGNTGTGKTALALQIAASCGCPALYVSAEMARIELLRRIIARCCRVYLGRLKTGELPPGEAVAMLRTAAATCPRLAIADATLAIALPAWLQKAAAAVRGDSKHLLIVVDSLHSWSEPACPVGATEYEALNAGLAALRQLAQQFSCPVLALAERNRASIKNGGLNAGAGSRKIEYGAETVLDLDRDLDVSADGRGEVPVRLHLKKNRNGSPGRYVDLLFHGALQSFREVE